MKNQVYTQAFLFFVLLLPDRSLLDLCHFFEQVFFAL